MDKPCVVGTCKCGGYGVIYDAETEAKLGRCHDDQKDLRILDIEKQRDDLFSVCGELMDLVDLAQEDVDAHEYETIRSLTLDRAKTLRAQIKAGA